MLLRTKLFGKTYEFGCIKELMAKANEEKSGDRQAGIAAESVAERMAAKHVLAEVPLEVLRENPAVPYEEDEVTRVIQDAVNETIYNEIKGWTVGEFREWLLADTTTGDMVRRISGVGNKPRAVGEEHLQLALANLTRFPIVGLTDQFDATIRRWAPLLGWSDIQYKHRLAQPDRLKQEDLPASLVKAVRQRQQYDQALYECVLNRDWADG